MSAILSADDLNDFISPGVACIKPVETLPKEENSNPYEVTTEDKVQPQNPAPASISLTDCLACSGCVTSAEAVLVSLQSHTEVLNTLDSYSSINPRPSQQLDDVNGHNAVSSNSKLFVASVSPQVRASIAATYGISERRAGNMITQFLSGSQGLRIGGTHSSDFSYVLDTNRLREACLVLGASEVSDVLKDKSKSRPILTSACPGWICYAEKTHPHVLPHLSALKSPQALTGTLVKSVLSKALNIHPSQIWHLAIMPCFDKKLEASREELTDKWWSSDANGWSLASTPLVRDVDCVITSRELLTLAESRGIQLSSLPQTPIPHSQRIPFPDPILSRFLFSNSSKPSQTAEASTSGGYLHHILYTQQALQPDSVITATRGRNADVVEFTLSHPDSPDTPVLKCARYYGFRNIQNLVRKLKPARTSKLPGAARKIPGRQKDDSANEYAYVEVMACPGGCTNGGGQIKIEDVANTIPQTRGETIDSSKLSTPQSQKEWLGRIDEAYFSASSDTDSDDNGDGNGDGNGNTTDLEYTSNGYTNDDTEMIDSPSPSLAAAAAAAPTIINGINTTEIQQVLTHWSNLVSIPLDKLAYTTFRKVESDVGKKGKNLGDSERIAAIAGMSGGGW